MLPAIKRCPRCGAPSPPLAPIDVSSGWTKCHAVVCDCPYTECDFSAPRDALPIPVVRIGASGLTSCGQSTWNVVLHARLWNSIGPQGTTFSRVDWWKCNDNVDKQYEDLLNGLSLHATLVESRAAYWTLMRTSGIFGRSRDIILSIEDFAGEWIQRGSSIEDYVARRLLGCDAFVLFYDPTQADEGQIENYRYFFAQLRLCQKAMNRQMCDIPIALAIGKTDLISDCVSETASCPTERLIHELKASVPINQATTLAAIKKRHELTNELSNGLLPLRHLISLCESVVGSSRFSVFPIATFGWNLSTPEGLAKHGAWKSHQYLLKHSFGISDPLLWVLHQLGLRRLSTA